MKNKYGIGFLLFLILVVFGITCAYQLSLNKGKREIQAEINAKEQREMNDTSVAADGQALKDDCYYLKELNGYVVGVPSGKSSKRNSEWKIYRNIRKLIWFSGKLFQLNLKLTERTKDNG